ASSCRASSVKARPISRSRSAARAASTVRSPPRSRSRSFCRRVAGLPGSSTATSTRNESMIGLLVVTHGPLAAELVEATEKIVGEAPRMEAISLGWEEEQSEARKRIEDAIRRNDQGQGVLILTDLFGGTASNLSFAFRQPGRVDVVTGVN